MGLERNPCKVRCRPFMSGSHSPETVSKPRKAHCKSKKEGARVWRRAYAPNSPAANIVKMASGLPTHSRSFFLGVFTQSLLCAVTEQMYHHNDTAGSPQRDRTGTVRTASM